MSSFSIWLYINVISTVMAANMTYIKIPLQKRKQQFPAIQKWKDIFAMPFANS